MNIRQANKEDYDNIYELGCEIVNGSLVDVKGAIYNLA